MSQTGLHKMDVIPGTNFHHVLACVSVGIALELAKDRTGIIVATSGKLALQVEDLRIPTQLVEPATSDLTVDWECLIGYA